VNWFENDGTGIGWTTQVIDAAFDGSYGDRSLAVADLDGDGDLDVVAGSSDTNRELAWWANDGAGGGWSKHVLEVGFGAHSVDVGDVDGDGTLEIAAGSWTGGTPYNGEIKLWDFDQYAASGQLVSSILDTIDPGSWGSAAWTAAVPTGAAVLLEVRGAPWFGDIEDATWSTVGSSGDPMLLPDDAVYIQYRVTLTSSDDASPALQEVALSWEFASSDDDDSATDDDDATPDDDDATPDDDDATPDDDDSAATDDDDSSADDDDSSAGDDDDSGGGGGAGCDGCQATGRGAATGFALLAVVAVGLRRRRLRP
jgi:MYXO-CTERM domain-containing protein